MNECLSVCRGLVSVPLPMAWCVDEGMAVFCLALLSLVCTCSLRPGLAWSVEVHQSMATKKFHLFSIFQPVITIAATKAKVNTVYM